MCNVPNISEKEEPEKQRSKKYNNNSKIKNAQANVQQAIEKLSTIIQSWNSNIRLYPLCLEIFSRKITIALQQMIPVVNSMKNYLHPHPRERRRSPSHFQRKISLTEENV